MTDDKTRDALVILDFLAWARTHRIEMVRRSEHGYGAVEGFPGFIGLGPQVIGMYVDSFLDGMAPGE